MNSATITLENVSDEFLKVFKELAKVANAKFKVDKSKKTKAPKNLKEIPNKETLKAMKEYKADKAQEVEDAAEIERAKIMRNLAIFGTK